MVDTDGKNRYRQAENWLTDGYGDYVRHYLRAMAVMSSLAPPDEDHSSRLPQSYNKPVMQELFNKFLVPVVRNVDVANVKVYYSAFDNAGLETIRLRSNLKRSC
ncbi:MAG TPA: hypothetical protein VF141_15385 [Chryseolinea sp.]